MPELPEVQITAQLLDEALRGCTVESALAPGVKVMRTFDPPLSALAGAMVEGVRRRGKHLIVDVCPAGPAATVPAGSAAGVPDGPERDVLPERDGPPEREGMSLLMHLMSSGRLQLYDKRAGLRDRTSRLLVRLSDGRELRLREFGTKQSAWAKLLRTPELERDEALAGLGPEAWPHPPDIPELRALLDAPRPLHAVLRDQHVIAGIGRSWVDEILWEARLSPFKRGSDIDEDELACLRASIVGCLGAAVSQYERTLSLPLPDKLPMPLRVHRHEGEPCPRCSTTLLAVHFEDYVIAYCPSCQTEGRPLKDRRMSRLLK